MWLVYLRFKGNGAGKTYHVSAENKRRVDKIVAMAQRPVAVGMVGGIRLFLCSGNNEAQASTRLPLL